MKGRESVARPREDGKVPHGGDREQSSVGCCLEPKITFGIIVLNGEPFTRYLLRTLYPYAHQIIVAEGACPGAVSSSSGHSVDGTIDVLREFTEHEDPGRKVVVVQQEGFWTEKTEQTQAIADLVTGDYLWVCDIDEFYTPTMIETVVRKLGERPEIDMLSFQQVTFWGAIAYVVDSYLLRRGHFRDGVARVFKWAPGYSYATHRPPTVRDSRGNDLRNGVWLRRRHTERWQVRMLHYSLLFPGQVMDKCCYYLNAPWCRRGEAVRWVHTSWLRLDHPFRVHNVYEYLSWLERYNGVHPPQIVAMMDDIDRGIVDEAVRGTEDIEELLSSPCYRCATLFVRAWEPLDRLRVACSRQIATFFSRVRRRVIRTLAARSR